MKKTTAKEFNARTKSGAYLNDHIGMDGAFVTVEMNDGKMFVGLLIVLDEETVQVVTGVAGRNPVLWVGDIDEVLKADGKNPHIEKVG